MTFSGFPQRSTIIGGLALALATLVPSARANVYATNVRINGGTTNISVALGTNVSISYILNEPASAGVAIKVLSGATAVRTISLAGGEAGAMRGTNAVVWDGKDNYSNNVPGGNYSVSIMAASSGYSGWTVTTDDDNDGNYSWAARGIAVDRNTNSPYYGRVFVGNSYPGPGSSLGDLVGIQKLNADGSYADEGGFSDGGVAWPGQYFAPWKIRVSDDDKVYVEDWSGNGDVYRFDPVVSSNSMLHVLRADNDGPASLSGIAIVGGGTNTQIWMADNNSPGGVGILKYAVTADGTCATNDTGTTVVGVGGLLDLAPFDVALDKGGNIYTVQSLVDSGNPAARVLRFPAYDPSTNAPETNATWAVGAGDDNYAGAHGLAVDPTGTYVAVTCWGVYDSGWINGSTMLCYATNGAVATNVDLGISIPSNRTTDPDPPLDPTHHMDTDCDWDAAGNLYYLDNWPGVWRAVSPPGTNQTTTVALANVQVAGSVAPATVHIVPAGVSSYTITYAGGAGSQFVLVTSPAVNASMASWTRVATNTAASGSFTITPSSRAFYRVKSE
jgi:hypothetical protein